MNGCSGLRFSNEELSRHLGSKRSCKISEESHSLVAGKLVNISSKQQNRDSIVKKWPKTAVLHDLAFRTQS